MLKAVEFFPTPVSLICLIRGCSIKGYRHLIGSNRFVFCVLNQDINKHFVSTYLKGCSMQIDNVDSQPSHEGGVLVLVSGSFTVPDAMKRRFTQSFFLAPQKGGYFVLNDVLRYIPVEPGN